MSWLKLQGRVAVITGASGGIGRAIAQAFVDEGVRVAMLDLPSDALNAAAEEIGGIPVPCDVSDDAAVAQAAASVDKALGPVDILVNNAARSIPGGLDRVSIADWQKMLDVNLTGYLRCAQSFGIPMLERGRGALVHISSIAALHATPQGNAYASGKAAVSMLSKQLAVEWGPRGVRSNTVAPGLIRTPLSEAFYADPWDLAAREAVVPLRRIGRPEDIADAVLYLSSDRASYVTGDELTVDGAFTRGLMSHIPRPGYD